MDATTGMLLQLVAVLGILYVVGLFIAPKLVRAPKKVWTNAIVGAAIALVAINYSPWGPIGFLSFLPGTPLAVAGVTGVTSPPIVAGTPVSNVGLYAGCGDTKTTTMNVTTLSNLNTTGAEGFSMTLQVYSETGESFGTLTTATTGGTATVDCGRKYILHGIAANADEGDNTVFKSVTAGNAQIDASGNLVVVADQPNVRVTARVDQHGIMQARGFDIKNNGFMFAEGATGGTATEWISSPAVFESTTNATNMTVGVGGEVHGKYYIRSTRTDTNFNDRGICMFVDATAAIYEQPTVYINGALVTDSKAALLPNENDKYGSVAKLGVYCTDVNPLLQKEANIDLDVFAKSGVDPATANFVNMTLVTRGQFLSKDGVTTKVQLVDDTTAVAPIYAPFNIVQAVV